MWCMVPVIRIEVVRIFCHFEPFLALLSHSQSTKSKFWINEKNTWRKYWFKLVHHDNHIMHGSWDTKHDGQDFLSFRTILYPFTPLTQKIKIFKKIKKKHLELLWFYKCVPWMTIIWCMVPEICSMTENFLSFFGPFFAFTPLITPKKKLLKKWKKTLEIMLHMCTIKDHHMIRDLSKHFWCQ